MMHRLVSFAVLLSLCDHVWSACYFPNGQTAVKDAPCNNDADYSACCGSGFVCLSNGMCATLVDLGKPGDQKPFFRASCTDKSWTSGSCPSYCLNPKLDSVNWAATMGQCKNNDKQYFCKRDNSDDDCKANKNLVAFAEKPTIIRTIDDSMLNKPEKSIAPEPTVKIAEAPATPSKQAPPPPPPPPPPPSSSQPAPLVAPPTSSISTISSTTTASASGSSSPSSQTSSSLSTAASSNVEPVATKSSTVDSIPPAAQTTAASETQSGLSSGAKLGIGLGAGLGGSALLAAGIIFAILRRRRAKSSGNMRSYLDETAREHRMKEKVIEQTISSDEGPETPPKTVYDIYASSPEDNTPKELVGTPVTELEA